VADADIKSAVAAISAAGAYVIPNLSFIAMTSRLLEDADRVFADEAFARLAPDVQQLWRSQNPARRPDVDAFARRERVKRLAVARLTALLQAADVPLLLGTDASASGLFPGRSAHLELQELVQAGLTPYQALSTGTRTAARFLERFRRPRAAQDPAASPPGIIAPGHAAHRPSSPRA
jgi:imidazolonepropionase-like amidohydrolase